MHVIYIYIHIWARCVFRAPWNIIHIQKVCFCVENVSGPYIHVYVCNHDGMSLFELVWTIFEGCALFLLRIFEQKFDYPSPVSWCISPRLTLATCWHRHLFNSPRKLRIGSCPFIKCSNHLNHAFKSTKIELQHIHTRTVTYRIADSSDIPLPHQISLHMQSHYVVRTC